EKSLEARPRPRPKWNCQMRLTITRAVGGLSLAASHSASTRRRPEVCAWGRGSGSTGVALVSTDGKPGSTFAPLLCGLPRRKTKVSSGHGPFSAEAVALYRRSCENPSGKPVMDTRLIVALG